MTSRTEKVKQKIKQKMMQKALCSNMLKLLRDPIHSTLISDQTKLSMISHSSKNKLGAVCRVKLLQHLHYVRIPFTPPIALQEALHILF